MCQHQKKMQENDIFTDFTLESTSQRNRIEKNLVKVIFSWGLFKEKKTSWTQIHYFSTPLQGK